MIRLAAFNKLLNHYSYDFFCARGFIIAAWYTTFQYCTRFYFAIAILAGNFYIKEIIERWDQMNTFFKEPPRKYASSIMQARINSGSSEMVILKIYFTIRFSVRL